MDNRQEKRMMFLRNGIISLFFVVLLAIPAHADVDAYIDNMNIYASRHFDDFRVDLMTHFGISNPRFNILIKKVESPGDLAVSLWLGKKTSNPIDDVIRQYRIHHNKGWGVISRELGVKPGTPTFHALKSGRIDWTPRNFKKVIRADKKEKAIKRKQELKKKRLGY